MDLRQLKYFISVFEQGSFNAAAKHCFIAQPSISSAISHLEQEIGQSLFVRHARGITPTEAGKQLFPMAKNLIGQARAIQNTFEHQDEKHDFSLGVTKGLGVNRMSQLLKQFIANEPLMELTLVSQNDPNDARIIIKEELDNNEQYTTIWQEEYVIALPIEHPLSLKDNLDLQDLDQLDFIQRTPCSAWQLLNDTLTLSGYQLSIRAKIQTIDYALGLVSAGLGGALIPAHKEIIELKDICFKSLHALTLHREIVLAYHHDHPMLNGLKSSIKLVK